MPAATKRKTSLSMKAHLLDEARSLELNVSAIAEEALQAAVDNARTEQWRAQNAHVFQEQAAWHEQNEHPLAAIMVTPGKATWKD